LRVAEKSLFRFFGLSKGCWLRAQAVFDIERAEAELAKELDATEPFAARAKA
jgi:plasmid maintenance system antidote protein VapI